MASESGAPAPMFTAAGNGRRLRAWRPPMSGPNSATLYGQGTILNRSRDAARNSALAGAAIDKSVANGIGTGIQAKADWGTPEHRARAKVLWDQHMEFCDADWVLDGYGLQAMAWREWKEAGEVFVRFRDRRPEDGLPVPLQVQLIESEQCPADYYAIASNGNPIRAGIEFTKYGKRAAYWMYPSHPGDYNPVSTNMQLVRVPAEHIHHVFKPARAGAHRGIPDATAILPKLFNVESMDDATLMRMQIGNLFSMYLKRSKPESDGEDGALSDGSTETDVDDTPMVGLEPGSAFELPEGVEPTFSDPPDAGNSYDAFMRLQLLAIAARYGVPYEVLTGDLRNVSDRALRLILNEFRRSIEMEQWLYLIPQMLRPWRRRFFDAAVLSGALSIPGYGDLRLEVSRTLWVPQGWPYSHPVQDVTADIKAIEANLTSRTAVILSNGDDPEQVDAEIAQDQARAAALGISKTESKPGATAPPNDEPKEDEDAESA
jgi:lambda family phage portal protein